MAGLQQEVLLFDRDEDELHECMADCIASVLDRPQMPSARELVAELDRRIGVRARWYLEDVLRLLRDDATLTRAKRDYLASLIEGDDLIPALRGRIAPDREAGSVIDALLRESGRYRQSGEFREMIEFMGRFKDYSPYNNCLVRLQNPSCSFYATAADWYRRFGRWVKEDGRPMLILAPMHPVLPVYDLDETEGGCLPVELENFGKFEGLWEPEWLERLVENAGRHGIRVDFRELSRSCAGFATSVNVFGDRMHRMRTPGDKMRIVVHAGLREPDRFGVLCHEMAHVLLGHLGNDWDQWWPARSHLGKDSIEIEAEATAYIVTRRFGLEGDSVAYVSRYLGKECEVPAGVSCDMIARVAGRIERMARKLEPAPPTRPRRERDTAR